MTVEDLFQRVMNRMKTMPPTIQFVDAAQGVQEVITRRLLEQKSDLLKDPWASDSQAAETSKIDLPGDMIGRCDEDPYITYTSGSSTAVAVLQPLSGSRADYVNVSSGTPQEFEIFGLMMELFPACNVAFTLHVSMFRKPAPLVALSSELPWNGVYDQIFQDAVLYLAGPTGSLAALTPGLEMAIMRAVDTGATLRTGRKVSWLCA